MYPSVEVKLDSKAAVSEAQLLITNALGELDFSNVSEAVQCIKKAIEKLE